MCRQQSAEAACSLLYLRCSNESSSSPNADDLPILLQYGKRLSHNCAADIVCRAQLRFSRNGFIGFPSTNFYLFFEDFLQLEVERYNALSIENFACFWFSHRPHSMMAKSKMSI